MAQTNEGAFFDRGAGLEEGSRDAFLAAMLSCLGSPGRGGGVVSKATRACTVERSGRKRHWRMSYGEQRDDWSGGGPIRRKGVGSVRMKGLPREYERGRDEGRVGERERWRREGTVEGGVRDEKKSEGEDRGRDRGRGGGG